MNNLFIILVLILSFINAWAAEDDHTVNDHLGCRIFPGVKDEKFMPKAAEEILTVNKNKALINVHFKSLRGEDFPLTLRVERLILEPGKFNSSRTLGAKYSFNNPFESNSLFSRNDQTGETKLIGRGIDLGVKDTVRYVKSLNSQPRHTTINPYFIYSVQAPDSENSEDTEKKLIAPDGRLIDHILVVCFTSPVDQGRE